MQKDEGVGQQEVAINGVRSGVETLKTDGRVSPRPSWDDVWMAVCDQIGGRSLCVRAHVGAVIVSSDNRVQAISYNGPPPGLELSGTCDEWCPRARAADATALDAGYNDCVASHAEINAIARCNNADLDGATIYVNGSLCYNCAKAIAATKIAQVVMRVNATDSHRNPMDVATFLEKCGVEVVTVV